MRKKSLLLAAGLLLSVYSFAQLNIIRKNGGHIINDSTIVVNGIASSLITDSIYVINAGSSPLNVTAKRDIISQVNGSSNWFCWGAKCFSSSVDSSNDPNGGEPPVPITNGDTNKTFYCDYNAVGTVGTTFVRYVFINGANRADTSWVIIEFNATLTGVKTISGGGINFSTPYPNPSNSFVNINYNLTGGVQSANLKIYNLVGECVQTLPLSASKNKSTVDVQNMPSGIYVCEIQANGCQPVYQKLVVSH